MNSTIASVQFASDVHLEFEPNQQQIDFNSIVTPVPNAKVLILAGDIGNPKMPSYSNFLAWCSKRWPAVLVVSGNHEYYMGSVPEIDSIMKNMCSQFPNVKYLQKEAFSVALSSTSQLVVLGCTLWSEMNPKQLALVKTRLNDYNHIAEFKADANYAVKLHQDQVSWLRAALNETIKLKSQKSTFVVVATHHGPLLHGTSEAYYDNSPINCAFASDLGDLIQKSDLWIFGHTHYNTKIEYKNKYVVANQRGYVGSELCKGYSSTCTYPISNANFPTELSNPQTPTHSTTTASSISPRSPQNIPNGLSPQVIGEKFVQHWFSHFPNKLELLLPLILNDCVLTMDGINFSTPTSILACIKSRFKDAENITPTSWRNTKVESTSRLDNSVIVEFSSTIDLPQTSKRNKESTFQFQQTFHLICKQGQFFLLHTTLYIAQ